MNKKITLLIGIAIFSNLALAQGIGSPGLNTNSDGTATQEIELNRGWNNIAVNVEGSTFSEAASEGTCEFEGSGFEVGPYESFAFKTDSSDNGFAPISLDDELDPTVGYTVGVLESCTLEFSGEEALSASTERTIPSGQWSLITLPENFSPNDLKDIVEETDLGKVKVSRTLKKMEKRGLIEREENGMSKKVEVIEEFQDILAEK